MKDNIKVGIIGFGSRAQGLWNDVFSKKVDEGFITFTHVCDLYEDRAELGADMIEKKTGIRPIATTDYKKVIADKPDAILIITAWEAHVPVAIEAMKAGIYVGTEVGGAYTLQDCWDLVNTYEQTKTPLYFLENCCFGRRELMIKNMVDQGVLGEVVHCAGAYCHDLREEVTKGDINRHYRLRNYQSRNCENYPTHELGPIAKVLGINDNNRMLSLVSVASKAVGANLYAKENNIDIGAPIVQADIVTTVIKCQNGETITLTLDTTLPRNYSRKFAVHATKGKYEEDTDSIFLDGEHDECHFIWKEYWGNAEKYAEKYEHPIWKEYRKNPIGGHDGIDWLVFSDFFNCVRNESYPTLDVYDAAAWMCITPLSEQSIKNGGSAVEIPDFKNKK